MLTSDHLAILPIHGGNSVRQFVFRIIGISVVVSLFDRLVTVEVLVL